MLLLQKEHFPGCKMSFECVMKLNSLMIVIYERRNNVDKGLIGFCRCFILCYRI